MSTTITRQALVETFVIEGGHPLNGTVRAAGNKNAALPIVAACLLTDEPVTLSNVPAIRDVETMLELAADLGADIERLGPGEIRIHAADEPRTELDEELGRSYRRREGT
jgi:UDP-N-acetylglucosamine 1-carboxyvinyltransferase